MSDSEKVNLRWCQGCDAQLPAEELERVNDPGTEYSYMPSNVEMCKVCIALGFSTSRKDKKVTNKELSKAIRFLIKENARTIRRVVDGINE